MFRRRRVYCYCCYCVPLCFINCIPVCFSNCIPVCFSNCILVCFSSGKIVFTIFHWNPFVHFSIPSSFNISISAFAPNSKCFTKSYRVSWIIAGKSCTITLPVSLRGILIKKISEFRIVHIPNLFPLLHWFQNTFCFLYSSTPSHVGKFLWKLLFTMGI